MAKRLLVLLLAALLPSLLASCGHKAWPEPEKSEDAFYWMQVEGERNGECLVVSAQASGAFQNISEVELGLQKLDEENGCPGCPFRVEDNRVFHPEDPGLVLHGPFIEVRVCGLDPDYAYRWQLSGTNVYSAMRKVVSDTQVSNP